MRILFKYLAFNHTLIVLLYVCIYDIIRGEDVRIDSCQSEPLQFGSYMTVSNGQLCMNIGGSSNCIGVANPYYRTFPSVSVYQYGDEGTQTENSFQSSNGTIYTYSYFSSCPGLVLYMQATKQ